MDVEYVQKCATNAIELLRKARHNVTGEEWERFYAERAMPLLNRIATGQAIVIATEDYQKLLDNQKQPRKKPAK